ncbi:MAG TPA: ABC transporter ATP-binding protein, partial [Casimicrobiaceae bacterium]
MNPYLAIDAVSVAYGDTTVLHDVNLDVARGELCALLGSSGCGKTTLLRSIAGFVRPTAGAIRVEGRDILGLPPEKRGTAMMFQSYALWPHMSVADNIGYGLRMRGWKKDAIAKRVLEMLDLLQLEGFGPRPVTQLSGGQRQRVALGRALAVDPQLLLLDEPMSNLDYKVRIELRHELRALQRRIGITAVYVTHDREEALTLADRIAVLDAGRVAQYGTPEEIFHRPASAFVAGFMGADNALAMARSA